MANLIYHANQYRTKAEAFRARKLYPRPMHHHPILTTTYRLQPDNSIKAYVCWTLIYLSKV